MTTNLGDQKFGNTKILDNDIKDRSGDRGWNVLSLKYLGELLIISKKQTENFHIIVMCVRVRREIKKTVKTIKCWVGGDIKLKAYKI